MKRISAILLAFLLCIIAAFPAFAADDYEAPTESETQTEKSKTRHSPLYGYCLRHRRQHNAKRKSTLKVTIKTKARIKKFKTSSFPLPRTAAKS